MGAAEEEVALTIRLVQDTVTKADLQSYSPTLDVHYTSNQIPSSSSSSSSLATYIANTLRSLFTEEQAMIAYLLSTSSAPPERSPKALDPSVAEKLAKWTTRSMKYSRTYHLTFSLFTILLFLLCWERLFKPPSPSIVPNHGQFDVGFGKTSTWLAVLGD